MQKTRGKNKKEQLSFFIIENLLSPILNFSRNYWLMDMCEDNMDINNKREKREGESQFITKNSLDFLPKQLPHSVERRGDWNPAEEVRLEDMCHAESQIDAEIKRMVDILVDMAFRKIMARQGTLKVAKER
jgi:hypothetical protein